MYQGKKGLPDMPNYVQLMQLPEPCEVCEIVMYTQQTFVNAPVRPFHH